MSPRTSELFLRAQSDERLVTLSRAGHDRAFAVIVNRYRRELLGFARRQTSDGRAEDILQQSLLNAFAALHTGKEVKHLRGWLYQIVRNTVRGAAEQPTAALHESVGAGEPLERLVEQRMVAREVLAAVGNLPDRQREALVGSALHGLPGADLAETMGLSEGALRQLIHRARGAVRTAGTTPATITETPGMTRARSKLRHARSRPEWSFATPNWTSPAPAPCGTRSRSSPSYRLGTAA